MENESPKAPEKEAPTENEAKALPSPEAAPTPKATTADAFPNNKPRPEPLTAPDIIVVIHHSASNDAGSTIEDLIAERRRRNEGYNLIIDDDEALKDPTKGHDGKARVVADVPDEMISNGVYGANRIAVSICVDGNFESTRPTEDELDALVQAIAAKAKRWGWKKGDAQRRIKTHQEVGMSLLPGSRYVTACPGRHMIERMPEIRNRVSSYLPD